MGRTNGVLRAAAAEKAGGKSAPREGLRDARTMATDAAELRRLEKRYGDVKLLFRKRAEELGSDMSTSLKAIEDPKRVSRHIEVYDGTEMGLIATSIRNLVNLYEIDVNGKSVEAHAIWIFQDLKALTKNRYRYNSNFKEPSGFDRLYRETYKDRFDFDRLSNKIFERLYKDPSFVPRVEEFFLGAYAKALEFHDWEFVPNGLVFTGAPDNAFVAVAYSTRFGNDALGISIGEEFAYQMMLHIDPKEYHKLETTFVATFVHELTHLHKMDTGEVNEFAMTLLFDPHKNYNIWGFRELMDKMIEMQKEMPEDRSVLDRVDGYLVMVYMGLLVAANEFAKYNRDVRELFENDTDPDKLTATRDFVSLIRNSDVERAKKAGFVETLLSTDPGDMLHNIEIVGNRDS